ncbi:MAG TPA: hypothetical protein VL359_08985, partial [bacterium]|nr:hypothetical protein [bacterium]
MTSNRRGAAGVAIFLILFLYGLTGLAAQERLRILAATGTADQIVRALQAGADFNDHDWNGVTALMAAAAFNRDPRVVALLAR